MPIFHCSPITFHHQLMANRFVQNPILTTRDIKPSRADFVVESVLNPGVFSFDNKTWLLLRVAERPVQTEGKVSLPILREDGQIELIEFNKDNPHLNLTDPRMVGYKDKTYLSTLSHLRLVCSNDGINFFEPDNMPTKIFGKGALETFGIEDCRVSFIDDMYHLTYTQVSENGVGVGLMQTRDWQTFNRVGMILPPHNKDCAFFEETINGKYYCFHRPSGIDLGGNFIWIAESYDLTHWGKHQCILQTREGMWDAVRVGAGAAPIKTDKGWLQIYHGADANNRYCLGAILLDLDNPAKVLARSNHPIFEPTATYELTGFFGNVVFTNGHIVKGDTITMYYGASDEVICGATLSIEHILSNLLNYNV
jgi:beta-1,2-mannobiose phosphorylase / 1,2-beta-oligomannan phosphorylase